MLSTKRVIKMIKVLVVCMFVSCASYLWSVEFAQFGDKYYPREIPTKLSEWTKTCFSQLPEYTNLYYTILTAVKTPDGADAREAKPDAFKKALINKLQACRAKYEAEVFDKPEIWLGRQAPDRVKNAAFWAGTQVWDCVQKLEVDPDGGKVCVIGDIHGSLHALLMILWSLVDLGFLDDDFSITGPDFKIVLLGDYVDRGIYGSEVLYTLCLLKMAKSNWKKVYLLRGNHEYVSQWQPEGCFKDELNKKFGSTGSSDVERAAIKLIRCFPLAIFLRSGGNTILCCHGGINPGYSTADLLSNTEKRDIFEKIKKTQLPNTEVEALATKEFDKAKGKMSKDTIKQKIIEIFEKGDSETPFYSSKTFFPYAWAGNFVWSDFDYKDVDVFESQLSRGIGVLCHRGATTDYLQNNDLEAVVRAHEHVGYGLKIMDKDHEEMKKSYDPKKDKFTEMNTHWTDVIPEKDRVGGEFLLHKYHPVFTFSTASAAPSCLQPYNCFGILTPAFGWDDWRLKVYEGKTPSDRFFQEVVDAGKFIGMVFKQNVKKYVEIDEANTKSFTNELTGNTPVAARWADRPAASPVGDALVKKAKDAADEEVEEVEEEEAEAEVEEGEEEEEGDVKMQEKPETTLQIGKSRVQVTGKRKERIEGSEEKEEIEEKEPLKKRQKEE